MKRILLICSFFPLLTALGSRSGSAAQESPVSAAQGTLPQAREVIERHLQATNARAVLEKTSSRHVRGTLTIPGFGIKGSYEVWAAKPDRSLTRIELGAFGDDETGYDGQTGWAIRSLMGGATLLEGEELLQALAAARYDGELKSEELYESVQTVTRETFEGKDCYKVEVVLKALAGVDAEKSKAVRTSHEFYEVESGLLLGVRGTAASPVGPVAITSVSTEYKPFGQALMATKNSVEQMGQRFEIRIDSVEFDTVEPGVFALPQEIQTLLEAREAKAKPQ
jgi:hypothetical protein